jgi:hypothetical protein
MIVNAEVTVLIAAVMNSTIITARKHLCIIVANRARMIVIAEVTVLFATAIVNARMKVLLGLVAKQLNMMLVAYRALMIVIANVTVLIATVMNTVIITARAYLFNALFRSLMHIIKSNGRTTDTFVIFSRTKKQ